MKAMVSKQYGSPSVMHLEDVPKPMPKENELLVKIKASSVNALDWHFLRGSPLFMRLQFGLFKPKITILGYDIAGEVEAVGAGVTRFKPGDEVFGGLGFRLGGFAEYACIAEDGFVAHKPPHLSFEEAAAVPVAGVTALKALRDTGHVREGMSVLVNGAAGGVGTFSVQIAKSFGAQVTAVCSTKNLDLVRSIGADNAIDYTREDFTRTGRTYDLVLNNVGNRRVTDLLRTLKPGGVCVIVGFTSVRRLLTHAVLGPLISKRYGKKIVMASNEDPKQEEMLFLKDLLESRKVVPTIDGKYSLDRAAEAVGYVETGHARAKVIVTP
ncbi:MAG: zinc-binding dehydrogenase [Chitinivibrionales bacterium]|nr:zinc-binding dehydrogenase [Chitinivibrionales bacterium]MBD3357380.1 zinc-binding dehydrogenase [Chitinivibrionales bacterium]